MPQNKSVHTFEEGLIRIDNKTKQPKNSYSHALNIVPNNNILDNSSRSNEKGFDDYTALKTDDYNIIGYQWLGNEEYVFFIKHIEGQIPFNEVRYFNKEKNINTLLYSNLLLNFQDNKEITSTFRINYKGQRIIYWVDGLNDDRVLNIDINNTLLDISLISIESSATKPIIESTVIDSGGSVTSGQYFISLSYNIGDSFTTNPLLISSPISIVSEPYFNNANITDSISKQFGATDGDIIPVPTNKSIQISINNTDSNYDSYNILIIKANNDGFVTKVIKKISLDVNSYTYTGFEGDIDSNIDIQNLVSETIKYYASEAITQKENRLIRGNSKLKGSSLNYQDFANNIKVNYVINEEIVRDDTINITKALITDDYYKKHSISPSYLSNTNNNDVDNTSFMRDEVYSLGIGFELIDGTETDVFHIPGRLLNDIGNSGIGEYNRSVINNALTWDSQLINTNPYWKERNTAVKNSDDGGLLAYWRSDNVYKSGVNLPINGEKNTNGKSYIRHHKMPSDILEPIYRHIDLGNGRVQIIKRNLSLNFNNIVIPDELKKLITKIKFYYTPREGNNKSILSKGIIYVLPTNVDGALTQPNHFNHNLTNTDSFTNFEFISPDVNFKFKQSSLTGSKIKINGIDKASIVYIKSVIPQTPGLVEPVKFLNNQLEEDKQRKQGLLSAFGFYNKREIPKENNYSRALNKAIYIDSNFKGSSADLNIDFTGSQETSIIQIADGLTLTNATPISLYYPTLGYLSGLTVKPVELHPNQVRYLEYEDGNDGNFQRMLDGNNTNLMDNNPKYDTVYYISIIKNSNTLYGELEQLSYVNLSKTLLYNNENILQAIVSGGDTYIDVHHFKKTKIVLTPVKIGVNEPYASVFNPEATDAGEGNELGNRVRQIEEDATQSYGSFICETDINIRMRREGSNLPIERYFPKSFYSITKLRELERQANSKEYFYIDPAYQTKFLKLNFANSLNDNVSSNDDIRYSTRVIYSDKQELEDKTDNYRTIRANNYRDLPLNRGPISVFFTKQDKLFVITRDSLFDLFASNQSIKTDTGDNIVVGTGEFLSIEPTEIVSIEGGFGGTSSKWSLCETPFGYLFVDKNKNKVLLFGESLKDLNIAGLNENFELELFKQIPELIGTSFDDPIKGSGIISTFDPEHNRVLITKKDVKLLDANLAKFKGVYNPLSTYVENDIVVLNGNLYYIKNGTTQKEIINESNFSSWIINNNNLFTGNILIQNNPINGTINNITNTNINYTLNTGTTDIFNINQSGNSCGYEPINITKLDNNFKWIGQESTSVCQQESFNFKWIGHEGTSSCEQQELTGIFLAGSNFGANQLSYNLNGGPTTGFSGGVNPLQKVNMEIGDTILYSVNNNSNFVKINYLATQSIPNVSYGITPYSKTQNINFNAFLFLRKNSLNEYIHFFNLRNEPSTFNLSTYNIEEKSSAFSSFTLNGHLGQTLSRVSGTGTTYVITDNGSTLNISASENVLLEANKSYCFFII